MWIVGWRSERMRVAKVTDFLVRGAQAQLVMNAGLQNQKREGKGIRYRTNTGWRSATSKSDREGFLAFWQTSPPLVGQEA